MVKLPKTNSQVRNIGNTDKLEFKVGALEKAFRPLKSHAPAKYSKKLLPPLWNEGLPRFRKLARKVFNR